MAQKITDKIVKSAPISALIWDEDVKGFAVRVTAAGSRAFVLNYRRKSDGRERRWTIGSFPDWGAGAARDEAKRLKRLIDGGADPVGEHQAESKPDDLCKRYEDEYLPRKQEVDAEGLSAADQGRHPTGNAPAQGGRRHLCRRRSFASRDRQAGADPRQPGYCAALEDDEPRDQVGEMPADNPCLSVRA